MESTRCWQHPQGLFGPTSAGLAYRLKGQGSFWGILRHLQSSGIYSDRAGSTSRCSHSLLGIYSHRAYRAGSSSLPFTFIVQGIYTHRAGSSSLSTRPFTFIEQVLPATPDLQGIYIHRAFSKDRLAFSLPARDCFLQAAFEWLCWLTLLTDDPVVPKTSCSAGLALSRLDLARHPTGSVLLILACSCALHQLRGTFSAASPSGRQGILRLHCHICTTWVDIEVFTLALLRWIRSDVAAVVSLFLCTCSCLSLWGASTTEPTWCMSLLQVATSGLLFSPASSLPSALTFSLGLSSCLWANSRHVHLVSLRGSLATAVSQS